MIALILFITIVFGEMLKKTEIDEDCSVMSMDSLHQWNREEENDN